MRPRRLWPVVSLPAILALGIGWSSLDAQTATPAVGLGTIVGAVVDSIHLAPLAGAEVSLDGTSRVTRTAADGSFHFDSVMAGPVRMGVFHPVLDSLGAAIASPRFTLRGGDTLLVTLSTPSPAGFTASSCHDVPHPAALNTPEAMGPGEIVGRVLDADTDRPIGNVEVSVTWVEIQAGKTIGYHRDRHTRAATTSPSGDFRLCYLPRNLDGELHAIRRDGGAASAASAVIRPVMMMGRLLTLITVHMAPLTAPTIAALADAATMPTADSEASPAAGAPKPAATQSAPPVTAASRPTPVRHYAGGAAELTGQVLNPSSQPLVGARVFVVGAADSAITDNAGNFTLRQLPAGTRLVVVRAIGFQPVTATVELTNREPQHIAIPFTARAIPVLRPVVVTARYDSALHRVGFDRRKLLGMGTFWTADQIDSHRASDFHDLFGTVPGVMIDYNDLGQASLMASRAAGACIGYATGANGQTTATPGQNCGPCLTYVIDGMPYDELEEGDMDTYIRPTEIGAIEIYQPNQVPQTLPGVVKPNCVNVVVWSKAKLGI